MKQQPLAIIPYSELMKISPYVERAQCQLPDINDLVREIAGIIETAIEPLVRDEKRRAFGITEYNVKHECTHTTLRDLCDELYKRTKQLI